MFFQVIYEQGIAMNSIGESNYIPTLPELEENITYLEKEVTHLDRSVVAIWRAHLNNAEKQHNISSNQKKDLMTRLDMIEATILSLGEHKKRSSVHDVESQAKKVKKENVKEKENAKQTENTKEKENVKHTESVKPTEKRKPIVTSSGIDDVVVPLFTPRESLEDFTNREYPQPGDMREGLLKIGAKYDICRIRGDGHCLFRAIASGVLLHNPKNMSQALKNHPELQKKVNIEREKASIARQDFLNSATVSKELVQFLRNSAADSIEKKYKNDSDAREIILFDSPFTGEEPVLERFKKYVASMRSMGDNAPYGGQPEILVLQELLGLSDLKILDAELIGKGQSSVPQSHDQFTTAPFVLLRRGMHYDLLVPKS